MPDSISTGVPADAVLPALFRRYPQLGERLPWLPLATTPTPVEPLRLERFGSAHWIKRDDLSGPLYGGNKVRKLEWLLAEARRRGAERLITLGAAGSHHCLATAVYGRRLGFEVTVALFPQPVTDHVREVVLRLHHLGAELRYAPRIELLPLAVRLARRAHRRERCVVIAAGGSDAFGTLGYVSGALELATQVERGEVPLPETVHLAAGTMGTAAGLAIGLELAGLPTRVAAVRITSRLVTNRWALRRLVNRTLELLSDAGLTPPKREAVLARIDLRHDYIGAGYGYETPDARRASELFAEAGFALEPTYTAKAAVGFLDALERGPVRPHLFWHTLSSSEPETADPHPPFATLPARFQRYLREPPEIC
jgi:D-cysteine desulfhydrase